MAKSPGGDRSPIKAGGYSNDRIGYIHGRRGYSLGECSPANHGNGREYLVVKLLLLESIEFVLGVLVERVEFEPILGILVEPLKRERFELLVEFESVKLLAFELVKLLVEFESLLFKRVFVEPFVKLLVAILVEPLEFEFVLLLDESRGERL